MQRAVQRAKKASRLIGNRKKRQAGHKKADELFSFNLEYGRYATHVNKHLKAERINRRTDWETGRLAPRRDVGDEAKTYGAIRLEESNLPERLEKEKLKWWHIVEGDRVVVTRGRDKGKIARVTNTEDRNNSVTLKGVNTTDQAVPSWLTQDETNRTSTVTRDLEVPIEDVRLVFPLPDPSINGEPRDVIIDRLQKVMRREGDEQKAMRVVPGTNLVIPWPETIEPTLEDQPSDTPQGEVEATTMTHTLLYPPIPRGVIDELRNKYARTRKRHDPEYIEVLKQRDAREQRRKSLTMKTPLQELAGMRKRQKQAAERQLTEAQLAKIGEIMISEREAAADKKAFAPVES